MTQSRYEYWCQLRVPARSWFRGRGAAEAKRARKAAKRRRDAELSRLGRIAATEQMIGDTRWHMAVRLDDWIHGLHDESAASARAAMRAIRRGEVVP